MNKPIETAIQTKLAQNLSPSELQVINESHMHNVPPGSESHFKVVVVSDQFADKRLVQRHQLVYQALSEELQGGVHALAIHAYTDEEWQQQGTAPASPQCMG